METVTLVGLWPTLSSVRKIPPAGTGCRLQRSVAMRKLGTMGGSGREQSHGGWNPWQSPSRLYLPRVSRWPHAGSLVPIHPRRQVAPSIGKHWPPSPSNGPGAIPPSQFVSLIASRPGRSDRLQRQGRGRGRKESDLHGPTQARTSPARKPLGRRGPCYVSHARAGNQARGRLPGLPRTRASWEGTGPQSPACPERSPEPRATSGRVAPAPASAGPGPRAPVGVSASLGGRPARAGLAVPPARTVPAALRTQSLRSLLCLRPAPPGLNPLRPLPGAARGASDGCGRPEAGRGAGPGSPRGAGSTPPRAPLGRHGL
nr:uncharacterized protein LOC115863359 [Globicephala melas]